MGCGGSKPTRSVAPHAEEHTYILLGVDGAGKTSLMHRLKSEKIQALPTTVPTVGFDKVDIVRRRQKLTLFDVGGGKNIRGIWEAYFADVHAAIFIVDAADVARFAEVRDLLLQAGKHDFLAEKPMLIIANKEDLPHAAGEEEVSEALHVHELPGRMDNHRVIGCSISAAESKLATALDDGIDWLVEAVRTDFKMLDIRRENERKIKQAADEKRREERKERLRLKRAANETQSGAPVEFATSKNGMKGEDTGNLAMAVDTPEQGMKEKIPNETTQADDASEGMKLEPPGEKNSPEEDRKEESPGDSNNGESTDLAKANTPSEEYAKV